MADAIQTEPYPDTIAGDYWLATYKSGESELVVVYGHDRYFGPGCISVAELKEKGSGQLLCLFGICDMTPVAVSRDCLECNQFKPHGPIDYLCLDCRIAKGSD